MRTLNYTFLILINFILQSTLCEYIAISGIKPNLLLILVISFAFMRGKEEGILLGFVSGLLIDSFFGMFLGLNAGIYLVIGWGAGSCSNKYREDSILPPFILLTSFSFLHGLLSYVFKAFLAAYPNIMPFLSDLIIPETIYTSILSFLLYRIYYLTNRHIEKYDRRKKNLFK